MIGDKIKELRKSAGLTQTELGELCGLNRNSIYKYEKNLVIPKLEHITKLANALKINSYELIALLDASAESQKEKDLLSEYRDEHIAENDPQAILEARYLVSALANNPSSEDIDQHLLDMFQQLNMSDKITILVYTRMLFKNLNSAERVLAEAKEPLYFEPRERQGEQSYFEAEMYKQVEHIFNGNEE